MDADQEFMARHWPGGIPEGLEDHDPLAEPERMIDAHPNRARPRGFYDERTDDV